MKSTLYSAFATLANIGLYIWVSHSWVNLACAGVSFVATAWCAGLWIEQRGYERRIDAANRRIEDANRRIADAHRRISGSRP